MNGVVNSQLLAQCITLIYDLRVPEHPRDLFSQGLVHPADTNGELFQAQLAAVSKSNGNG